MLTKIDLIAPSPSFLLDIDDQRWSAIECHQSAKTTRRQCLIWSDLIWSGTMSKWEMKQWERNKFDDQRWKWSIGWGERQGQRSFSPLFHCNQWKSSQRWDSLSSSRKMFLFDLFPARWEMSAAVMTRTKMIFSSPWKISLLFVRSQSTCLENLNPSEESDRQWNPPRWSLTKLFLRRISSAGHWICHCSPIVFPFSSSLEMQCSFLPDGLLPIIQVMSPRRMKFLLSLSSMSFFPSISRSELKITIRRVSLVHSFGQSFLWMLSKEFIWTNPTSMRFGGERSENLLGSKSFPVTHLLIDIIDQHERAMRSPWTAARDRRRSIGIALGDLTERTLQRRTAECDTPSSPVVSWRAISLGRESVDRSNRSWVEGDEKQRSFRTESSVQWDDAIIKKKRRHACSSRAFEQTASERIANDQPEEICHSLKSWSKRSIHVWRLRQETTHWTNERTAKRGSFVCSSLSNVEKAFDVDLGDDGAEWDHRSLPGDCLRILFKWWLETLEKNVHKGCLTVV